MDFDGTSVTLDIIDTSGAMEFPAQQELNIQKGEKFIYIPLWTLNEFVWLLIVFLYAEMRAKEWERKIDFVKFFINCRTQFP